MKEDMEKEIHRDYKGHKFQTEQNNLGGKLLTSEMVDIANKATEKYGDDKYGDIKIGVRVQDRPVKVGAVITRESFVWFDGIKTREKIGGVCAIGANPKNYHDKFSSYYGGYMLILVSDRSIGGEDIDEIILLNPIVVECHKIEN